MIEVNQLVYDYPGNRALDQVSFTIPKGQITALVGPNGAGKTTLLRCLAALATPISGSIRVNQIDVLEQPRLCHRSVGYLSDFFGLYEELTISRCLSYVAMASGMDSQLIADAVAKAAARLQLTERIQQKCSTLSRGLRQRVAIAQALIHEPPLLLLDEPASGLDPEARHSLAKLFLELQQDGLTLLVSSHILSELEDYSNDMLILRHGKIVEHRSLGNNEVEARWLKIQLSHPVDDLHQLLMQQSQVEQVEIVPGGAQVQISGDTDAQSALLVLLIAAGIPVSEYKLLKQDLQERYIASIEGLKPTADKATQTGSSDEN